VRAVLRPTVLALSTALLSAGLLGATLAGSPGAAATSNREAALLDKINHTRDVHGLVALRPKARLMSYAGEHSAAMAAFGDMFHTADFSVVCCWSAIDENIASEISVGRAHRALLASRAHRANILDPRMRRVGVGVSERAGELWVTEIFSKPA
jgi:uncharacterized protein YkwD